MDGVGGDTPPPESGGDGDEQAGLESFEILSAKTIQAAILQTKRSFSRGRKVQMKLLFQLDLYFGKVFQLLKENKIVQSRILDVIDGLQDLMVETTNMAISLSHPPSRIFEVHEHFYDIGAYIESVVIAVYTRCQTTGTLFGVIMKDFLSALLKIACDNPESWFYSVLISPIVLHMMNAFSCPDHEDFRIAWCYEIGDMMFPLAKGIFNCGDFLCQHCLTTVFSCWAKWTSPARALPVINSVFSNVDLSIRKELLCSAENVEGVRTFLNAFNLSSRGPKSIIPISCMYLFICDTEIRPPEHQVQTKSEFWMDFSIVSGRLHAFYSIPGAPTLMSLSIRRDQIDSVCLNWVVNDGRSQDGDTQENSDTQSTFMKDEKVLFFHIVLSVDFESVTNDIESLIGKHYRSIYFVFRNGELMEKVMKDMDYKIHECGSRNCERPRALRRLLTNQHKLSYTQSWCPESQVFGLDKSLNDTFASAYSHKSVQEKEFEISEEPLILSAKENEPLTQANQVSENGRNVSERSSAFYVSMSSRHTSPLAEVNEEAPMVNDALNVSTSTNFEDPLPHGVREKYSHLYEHAPFHQQVSPKKRNQKSPRPKNEALSLPPSVSPTVHTYEGQGDNSIGVLTPSRLLRKFAYVRNSSPNPSAPYHEPTTPPVSEIGSPHRNILNLTHCPENFAEESKSSSEEEIFDDTSLETIIDKSKLNYTNLTDDGNARFGVLEQSSVVQIGENERPLVERKRQFDYGKSPCCANANVRGIGSQQRNITDSTHLADSVADESKSSSEEEIDDLSLEIILDESKLNLTNLTDAGDARFGVLTQSSVIQIGDNERPLVERKRQSFYGKSPCYANANVRGISSQQRIITNATRCADNSADESKSSSDEEIDDLSLEIIFDESKLNLTNLTDAGDARFGVLTQSSFKELTDNERPLVERSDYGRSPSFAINDVDNEIGSQQRNITNSTHSADNFADESKSSSEKEIFDDTPFETLNDKSKLNYTNVTDDGNLRFGVLEQSSVIQIRDNERPLVKRKRQSSYGKSPCYANASEEWSFKENERKSRGGYDPYDLLTSSQMDEFREKIFPKTKTYSARKKNQLKIIRKKIIKLKKRKLGLNDGVNEINTEELVFQAHQPRKYRSFFRQRD